MCKWELFLCRGGNSGHEGHVCVTGRRVSLVYLPEEPSSSVPHPRTTRTGTGLSPLGFLTLSGNLSTPVLTPVLVGVRVWGLLHTYTLGTFGVHLRFSD